MIIDYHTHIGTIQYHVGKNKVNNLKKNDLLEALEKYNIDFALVSSIEGAEFDCSQELAPKEYQIPQLESMQGLVTFVKNNKTKIKALLWIKPYTEKYSIALEHFIIHNRKYIAGLKIHPTLSNLKFTYRNYSQYINLARKYEMPIQIHTENDGRSNISYVQEIAHLYDDVTFIMVHMGLNTDNMEAMSAIKQNRNIYGDTCVVSFKNICMAIYECGSKKILFGTDAIVNGIDSYMNYLPIIKRIKNIFTKTEVEDILFRNCARIYNLKI